MTTTTFSRSIDRPNHQEWQFPGWVPRSQALTAYDHDTGIFTVGDDLNIHVAYRGEEWIDLVVPYLAAVRRVGVVGDVKVRLEGYGSLGLTRWAMDLNGATLHFDTWERTVHSRTPGGQYLGFLKWEFGTKEFLPTSFYDDLSAMVLAVMEIPALKDQWGREQEQLSIGHLAYSRITSQSDGSIRLEVTPRSSSLREVAVVFKDQELQSISMSGSKDSIGATQDDALIALARMLSLKGGRRAGVHTILRDVLQRVAKTQDHPFIRSLQNNKLENEANND